MDSGIIAVMITGGGVVMDEREADAARFLHFLIGFGYMHDQRNAAELRLDTYIGKSAVQTIYKSIARNSSGTKRKPPTHWVRVIADGAGRDNIFGRSASAYLERMEAALRTEDRAGLLR